MFKNISSNLNESFKEIQKKLNSETILGLKEEEKGEEKEQQLVSQIEKTSLDRDHFRALATQSDAKRVELESLLKEKNQRIAYLESKLQQNSVNSVERQRRQSLNERLNERQPADGREETKTDEELFRLRKHLIQVEEEYTKEIIECREREEELEKKCETLSQEIRFLREKHSKRDSELSRISSEKCDLLNQLSQLEDKLQTSNTSVANLQLVVEQIQRENERKLSSIESKYLKQISEEKEKNFQVLEELKSNENRIKETLEALSAASRLSANLDAKEESLLHLKQEIVEKDHVIRGLKQELNELKESFDSRVDKQIIKSLIIGYFLAENHRKSDVQRLLARILDFNAEEMEKSGIKIGKNRKTSSSLTSLDESLSQKFVEFLENESKVETNKEFEKKEIVKEMTKTFINSNNHSLNPFLNSNSRRSSSTLSDSKSSSDNLLLLENENQNLKTFLVSISNEKQ